MIGTVAYSHFVIGFTPWLLWAPVGGPALDVPDRTYRLATARSSSTLLLTSRAARRSRCCRPPAAGRARGPARRDRAAAAGPGSGDRGRCRSRGRGRRPVSAALRRGRGWGVRQAPCAGPPDRAVVTSPGAGSALYPLDEQSGAHPRRSFGQVVLRLLRAGRPGDVHVDPGHVVDRVAEEQRGEGGGEDQAALGVGVEDLGGVAAVVADDVTGLDRRPSGHVLGQRRHGRQLDLRAEGGEGTRRGDDRRGAGTVGFHRFHGVG